ncbi:hypothetical protein C8R44DRAFT_751603 [Mycena epipterygia]|nr:hypothetical protein C8R44DRAFT_751603 [Mycena epipterygia]
MAREGDEMSEGQVCVNKVFWLWTQNSIRPSPYPIPHSNTSRESLWMSGSACITTPTTPTKKLTLANLQQTITGLASGRSPLKRSQVENDPFMGPVKTVPHPPLTQNPQPPPQDRLHDRQLTDGTNGHVGMNEDTQDKTGDEMDLEEDNDQTEMNFVHHTSMIEREITCPTTGGCPYWVAIDAWLL